MLVNKRPGFILILSVIAVNFIICLPSHAVDPEVVAKKALCHSILRKIYEIQRKVPEATAEFQAALALTPNDARLHFDYANFLAQTNRAQQAVSQYSIAARLKPSVAEYQAGLGNGCMYTKNYDGAVAAYTKACQLGGKFDKQLQLAQQYQAQTKQLIQYKQQVEKRQSDEED